MHIQPPNRKSTFSITSPFIEFNILSVHIVFHEILLQEKSPSKAGKGTKPRESNKYNLFFKQTYIFLIILIQMVGLPAFIFGSSVAPIA